MLPPQETEKHLPDELGSGCHWPLFRELCRCMLQKRRLTAIALNKVRGFHAARQRFKTQSTGPPQKIQRAFCPKRSLKDASQSKTVSRTRSGVGRSPLRSATANGVRRQRPQRCALHPLAHRVRLLNLRSQRLYAHFLDFSTSSSSMALGSSEGWFSRLKNGLSRTRVNIVGLFQAASLTRIFSRSWSLR